ncbi:MAG TPA: hypothetical protein VGS28_03390 [Candidatus Saccharimonadales bacterium]|nr:hypothetical protein [Candidatus Saccharimonadales bacterium]
MKQENESKGFNQKIASIVTNATGNMWFFWLSLAFILVLRVTQPPTASQFLLDVENDLQLLLLAANAVVSNRQTAALRKILGHIDKEADRIERMDKKEEGLLESR